MSLPRVAITLGDPAGIGLEIARKAVADSRVTKACEPVLYGRDDHGQFPPGQLSAEAGLAAFSAIEDAVRDALEGRVHAIATAPINKEAFALAGLPWRGHTDLLAHLTGAPEVAMMFYSEPIRVVLATVHVPLAEVPKILTKEKMSSVLTLTARELPRFGYPSPKIGVAGLNPHAGEGGLLGTEDRDVIAPAVESCRAAGLDVQGPFPGDTVFVRAQRNEFDVVVACYHDQGLIPVKLLAFGKSVNVTLGLPIIRTSVDHGTAFDIAGKGIADPGSLVEAILLASRLATGKTSRRGAR